MTTVPLKALNLTAFRGSCATFILPFEKERKLTLLYGENGTGKTTICDAFEFLALEKISSLEGYGLGGSLEKYWPSASKSPDDLLVALETQDGVCSGKLVNKKVQITPSSSRPRIELLRRQHILRLIQAQPKERYDAIKRFIDISNFERSEEALRQLSKSLAEERDHAHYAESQSLLELQGFYEAANEPAGLTAVIWAKQKLAQPAGNLDADIVAIGKLRSAFDAVKNILKRRESVHAAVAATGEEVDKANAALASAAAAAGDDATEILAVLDAGSKYLHAHPDANECPLCRSEENVSGLANEIAARLTRLSALSAAAFALDQRIKAFEAARAALAQLDLDYAQAISTYTTAKDGHSWKSELQLPTSSPPADLASLASWLDANDTVASGWPAIEASWYEEKKFTATLKAASERYDVNHTSRARLDDLLPRVQEALKLCVEQRQAFTNEMIGEIAKEVGSLYEKIHPGEGLDAIALPLDPNKRASIELEAKFSGRDVPPQAYFSQSHLDTLGLCVFLALASRDGCDDKILILDDVLGSVDEPHVERVVGVIYEVSEKFQHTIVTTHYRPWRERFRWGSLKPDQPCQFVELSGWNIEDGMSIVGGLPEIERLRALLTASPPDTQAICSKAGVILEYALDYLTQRYECAVPRRHGNSYTIGDLLPAVSTKLRDALKVEIRDGLTDPNSASTNIVHLKPILEELSRIAQVRNALGAHFKAISFDLLDQDAIGFANHVVQLVDALSHPDHGWPNNDKSGSYWRNSGDSRRLHPLKKPA
ncbi:MAG: ATP-binding protein [Rhizobiales bacterium]|nr:ATP-binding protein [Hyphomicrobiales bacterium]